MSIAICRVEKVKGASGVAGLQIHNRRERENSNSNPDIDHSRSNLNYAIVETANKSFNALADERIKQGYTGTKAIRKDAVRVVTSIFTSDTAFFENKPIEEQRRFFEDCLKWTQGRFGAENIISAIVHMDEETPHLHIEFVPLTADGRLTAKEVLGGRVDLQQMQDDFYKTVGQVWGMERGERADLDNPDDKPRKHKSTAQLKSETEQEIAALKAERDRIAIQNAQNAKKRLEMEKSIKALEKQETALKGKIKDLGAKEKELRTNIKKTGVMLDEIEKPSSLRYVGMLSNDVRMLTKEWEVVRDTALEVVKTRSQNNYFEDVIAEYQKMNSEIPSLQLKLSEEQVARKNAELELAKIRNVFKSAPELEEHYRAVMEDMRLQEQLLKITEADKKRIIREFSENPRSLQAERVAKEIYGDKYKPFRDIMRNLEKLYREGKFAVEEKQHATPKPKRKRSHERD